MIRELFFKQLFRHSAWPIVRKKFIEHYPYCNVCGNKKRLEVHHIIPVHLAPELELDFNNLITLCRPKRCHLLFGHLNHWKSYNPEVVTDSYYWKRKIQERPIKE